MPKTISRRLHRRPFAIVSAAAASLFVAPLVGAATSSGEISDRHRHHHYHHHQQQQCERLPTSLTYTQDTAPADISAAMRVINDKINRDVAGVLDVEVVWSGADLHRRVGEHIVRCTVARLASSVDNDDDHDGDDDSGERRGLNDDASTLHEHGRRVVTQCFEVPFTILDVNECAAPPSNPMAHQCHPPSMCINTLGSYECVCPSESAESAVDVTVDGPNFVALRSFWHQLSSESRNPWELSWGSLAESSCPGQPSTHGCCDEDGQSKEGGLCRSSFLCPSDPCAESKTSTCASNAACRRSLSPLPHPNYQCECPPGLMGNGHPCRQNTKIGRQEPKVKYDGVTPTEETRRALDAGLICGCSQPRVDACDGFPKCPGRHEMCTVTTENKPTCSCEEGYFLHPNYGCVDETPPILQLRPYPEHNFDPATGVTYLSQGDRYEEHGAKVIDDNAEEYQRIQKTTYSRPLPPGCLLEMGDFHANYTVATPWTTPPFVRVQRTVVIENVDECLVEAGVGVGADCPELVAMCDTEAGAVCKDEVGTYTCICPEGTEGDGFMPISRLRPKKGGFVGKMIPKDYGGGTGCHDTNKPVIELLGPNPKTFRVARPSRVRGLMGRGDDDDQSNARVQAILAEQRGAYESDIRSVIEKTYGAELCATGAKPGVEPTDCVHAEDHTHKGVVDLTSRVTVGEPIAHSHLQWRVPYNVLDDAGNEAKTIWRDVVVEEVDIEDFEMKVRADILADQKGEMDRVVQAALAKERKKQRNANRLPPDSPLCKPCDCSDGQHQHHHGGDNTIMSLEECNAVCDEKIGAAVAGAARRTCAPPYVEIDSGIPSHQIVQKMLVFMEGLMGPSAMVMLLLGCTIATLLYVLQRTITAIFFNSSLNVREYYHTSGDDERERIMMESVSYYRSPVPSSNVSRQTPGSGSGSGSTPLSSSATPRPPPTASISSQRRKGGIFSVQETSENGTHASQPSPLRGNGGVDSIYQSVSPITPLRNISNGTPASSVASQGSAGQRARYNLHSTNY